MTFNYNQMFEANQGAFSNSVQTSRKRRQIMHDNLTNSRGANRSPVEEPFQ